MCSVSVTYCCWKGLLIIIRFGRPGGWGVWQSQLSQVQFCLTGLRPWGGGGQGSHSGRCQQPGAFGNRFLYVIPLCVSGILYLGPCQEYLGPCHYCDCRNPFHDLHCCQIVSMDGGRGTLAPVLERNNGNNNKSIPPQVLSCPNIGLGYYLISSTIPSSATSS
jgi:hypothetical protein